ncbi:glycerophosphodiester phosphodiesterase family protein, partial [Nocardia carnea]|uniref:glycerophosphodiester phosphodiesterase family protein n=1 Tax=Nocardia carnea TaxID=37328 RepID=UPI003D7870EC
GGQPPPSGGGGGATPGGPPGGGPWVKRRRYHPPGAHTAAGAGRATYCWTVDEPDDIQLCADLGVSWVATNHPGRAKAVLANR